MGQILTPRHKHWDDFAEAMLNLIEPCDYTNKGAQSILQTIKGVDVEGTLEQFKTMGGYCDCEIRLNVCL
jgi:hypothetical protein